MVKETKRICVEVVWRIGGSSPYVVMPQWWDFAILESMFLCFRCVLLCTGRRPFYIYITAASYSTVGVAGCCGRNRVVIACIALRIVDFGGTCMWICCFSLFVLLTRFSRIFGKLNQVIKFHFALTLCFLDVYMNILWILLLNSTSFYEVVIAFNTNKSFFGIMLYR